MGKSKTKQAGAGKWSSNFKRYYRVTVGVEETDLRALEPEKLQFLISCPALVAIDFDPFTYAGDGEHWTAELKFRDLQKEKCAAVVTATGLGIQSVRGRMW